jgi:hypothetical protein
MEAKEDNRGPISAKPFSTDNMLNDIDQLFND